MDSDEIKFFRTVETFRRVLLLPSSGRNIKFELLYILCGRDSSVGIVTSYGLDGPGIESR